MAFPQHLPVDELVVIQNRLTAIAQELGRISGQLNGANDLNLLAHVRTASGKVYDAARHTALTAQSRSRAQKRSA